MIVIESKRSKHENILKKYPDAIITKAIIYDKKNEKPISNHQCKKNYLTKRTKESCLCNTH